MAHAGHRLFPLRVTTFIGYGLERFGALRHLDMQSMCGEKRSM